MIEDRRNPLALGIALIIFSIVLLIAVFLYLYQCCHNPRNNNSGNKRFDNPPNNQFDDLPLLERDGQDCRRSTDGSQRSRYSPVPPYTSKDQGHKQAELNNHAGESKLPEYMYEGRDDTERDQTANPSPALLPFPRTQAELQRAQTSSSTNLGGVSEVCDDGHENLRRYDSTSESFQTEVSLYLVAVCHGTSLLGGIQNLIETKLTFSSHSP